MVLNTIRRNGEGEILQPNQQDPIPGAGGESIPAISDHELLKLIARGSYGEVWLARNTLGAYRAVKIVFESTFRDKRPYERELGGVQRFEPVSRLHEGLMDVLQVGRNQEKGYFYCVIELADDIVLGQAIDPDNYVPHTLAREVARQKRLPLATCLEMGVAIASALEFLHERGLIHRDVKPSNIVFINGAPKLADIGLVAEMSEARSYVGTEGFIPPEGPGTVQADIYSLGKVLYEISTGKDRYEYPELPTLLDNTSHGAELIGLNRIILQACRTEPRQRYRSAGEMLQDLEALQKGKPIKQRRLMNRRMKIGMPVLGSAITLALLLGLFGRLRHPGHLHGAAGHAIVGSIPAPSGLVSWWRGEGDARDSAGQNHGSLIGDVLFAPGKVGQGFLLNGTNSYIRIPHDPSLNLSNEFTIELWFENYRMTQYNFGLIAKRGSETEPINFDIGIDPSGLSILYNDPFVQDGDAPQSSCEVSKYLPVPEPLTWHHLAATYRQAESNLVEVVTFLDGRQVRVRTMLGNLSNTLNNYPVTIGVNTEYPTYDFFEGIIDEVSLYRRALSSDEILAICNAGKAGKQLAASSRLARELVSCWRGDGDAKDSAGTNSGIALNGVSFGPGKAGRSFQLNGIDQYVLVPDSQALNRTDALTLGAWVFPRQLAVPLPGRDGQAIAGKDGIVSNRQYLLTLDVRQVFSAHVAVSEKGYLQLYGGTQVQTNTWYHVAMTYDEKALKLYVNGVLDASRAWTGPIMTSDEPFRIGGGAPEGVPPFHFAGLIDEVTLFSRALSESEIQTLYQLGNSGKSLIGSEPPNSRGSASHASRH